MRHRAGQERGAYAEVGEGADRLVAAVLVGHGDDDEERAQVHQAVREEVEDDRGDALVREDGEAEEHVAGVGDARVGEHALHVGLLQRAQVADGHRRHRQDAADDRPGRLDAVERAAVGLQRVGEEADRGRRSRRPWGRPRRRRSPSWGRPRRRRAPTCGTGAALIL